MYERHGEATRDAYTNATRPTNRCLYRRYCTGSLNSMGRNGGGDISFSLLSGKKLVEAGRSAMSSLVLLMTAGQTVEHAAGGL